jgi:eukaryotic-like serine/threonine-protein kinase
MIGLTLGPYRILDSLGAGGMGEVYRAQDSRLDRFVAVKILPAGFAGDPDRVRRFEQEARAAAALSHPNILAVHDVGQHEGVLYLVSELLEGETLRQRLTGHPLPASIAVGYAAQIAEGIAAAHDKGIVHRDLKPENLFITRDDRVKVLDFGLARLRPAVAAHEGATVLAPGVATTEVGQILGTAGYMAPEQVRGEPVDHRADIFALGAILYEMLGGRRAFTGNSAVATMAAILNEEPPELSALQGPSAPVLDRIVRRCLDKRPERRFDSARDLAFALQALGSGTTLAPQGGGRQRGPAVLRTLAALGVIALVALLAWLAGRSSAPSVGDPPPARRLTVVLPDGEALGLAEVAPLADGRRAIALSPDGSALAYVVNRQGTGELAVRRLDSFDARRLPGTSGAHSPFFSPDGASVAFFSGSALRRVAIEGGDPVTITEARNPFGGVWLDDGTIVFSDREGSQVVRVPAAGGAPAVIAQAAQPTFVLYSALPEGRGILIGRWGVASNDYRQVEVLSLDGERRTVLQGGTQALYAASGHLVFLRGGTVHAVPFDLDRLEARGDPVPLIGGVRSEQSGPGQLALARDGTLVYVEGSPGGIGTPVWVARDGTATPVGLPAGSYGQLRLSPDGRRIAIEVQGAATDIWVFEIERGAFTRLTQDGASVLPLWTPDSRRVTFMSERDGRPVIITRAADGSGVEEVLAIEGAGPPWSWSSDGLRLAVQCGESGDHLCIVEPAGDRRLRPIVASPFSDWGAAFSPDGLWIAYTSDVSGRYEVYVRPSSGEAGQWQVSTDGGEEPVWSRDGRELVYRYGFRWMTVSIDEGVTFGAGQPRVLFEGAFQNLNGFSHDISPDGTRFLMVQSPDARPATRLQVVLNWFEELRRLR